MAPARHSSSRLPGSLLRSWATVSASVAPGVTCWSVGSDSAAGAIAVSAGGDSGVGCSIAGNGALARATGTGFHPSAMGSAAGLTLAGATEEPLIAATTRRAERSDTNMNTVICAVNRPIGDAAYLQPSPRVVPRLRGTSSGVKYRCGCPPRGRYGP